MDNCMSQSKGLSLHYWVEAIKCANYIVNHTPTKDLKNVTLEKEWNTINPYINHFRVFGSVAWAHIPDEKRKDLQPKSEKCILLDIMKMSKVKYFFDLIPRRLLLEEMLNLMKISWPASLIRCLCHLWPAIHVQKFFHISFVF
jgi:hypothetical protein